MFHSKNHLGFNHICERAIYHLQSTILLLSLITFQPPNISWKLCFQLQNRCEYLLLTYPLPKKSEWIEVQLPFFQQGISHDTFLYSTSSETMGGFLSSTNLSTSPLPTKWSIKWTDSLESVIHIIVANTVSMIMKSTWLSFIYTRQYERKRKKTNLRKYCCQQFIHLDKRETLERINGSLAYPPRAHNGTKQSLYWSFSTWKRRKKRSKKIESTHQPAGRTTVGVEFPYWWLTFWWWKRQCIYILAHTIMRKTTYLEKDHKQRRSGKISPGLSYGTDGIG